MRIRNIAVFHNAASPGSAWCCAEGIVNVLRNMGYDVIDGGNPRRTILPIEALMRTDLIILGAPEWFATELLRNYGENWRRLRAIKSAWYAESFYRDDQTFDFEKVRHLSDLHFFPAIQDAEEFGGHWLPFGIDPSIFQRKTVGIVHDAAFLGTLYQKRVDYIARMGFQIDHIQSVASSDPRKSFELLAEAYSSTRIFVNLPALSRLLVTKVTEVMACGTLLLTPHLDHPSADKNMAPFQSGKHLIYYDPERPEEIRELISYYLSNPMERIAIANSGHDEVHKNHTMQERLKIILDTAEKIYQQSRQWWWQRLRRTWKHDGWRLRHHEDM